MIPADRERMRVKIPPIYIVRKNRDFLHKNTVQTFCVIFMQIYKTALISMFLFFFNLKPSISNKCLRESDNALILS